MRAVIALLCLLAGPAPAWEFRPDPVCTLSHRTAEAEVVVTFDPALPEYAIRLTLESAPWPAAPGFAIAFLGGPAPFTIQTDRQELGDGGQSLTVRDSGFGNVLLGLRTATTARAVAGDRAVDLPLEGIGPALAAFEACPEPVLS